MKSISTYSICYIILFILTSSDLFSQSTLVAELGNPIDITGWQTVSNGGGFVQGNEFILTQDSPSQQGAIYYGEAFNLNQCKKWRIEFDFKIWGNGDPAWKHGDGMAFWYLENPPTNFASGGTLGIPLGGRGIFVMMDTFDNLIGDTYQPTLSELQLYYGEMSFTGNSYENDPSIPVNYINTIPFGVNIRNSNFQKMIIEWDNGNLSVNLAGVQIYNGLIPVNDNVDEIESGYFGFSGATGAAHDQHSIRNVKVYMDLVELQTQSTNMYACDSDGDGFEIFDLTSQANLIINNPANYTINYFASQTDLANNNSITTPNQHPSGSNTVYVKVENTQDCFEIAEINLVVNSMPTQNTIPTQFLCDENSDGQEIVDLTQFQNLYINGNLTDLTFHYFLDVNLTIEIPQNQWNNFILNNFPTSVWIIAEKNFPNNQFCITVATEVKFELGDELPTNAEIFQLSPTPFCKDVQASINLDLTTIQNSITNETNVQYNYYLTLIQAQIGGNDFIPNPQNFNANASGSVYVRLTKNGFCFSIVRIDFLIFDNPMADNFVEITSQCDEDGDGSVQVNLDIEAIPLLVNDATGLTFTYYLTQNDAQNQTNPQNAQITMNVGTTTNYWVVISNGNCSVLSQIEIEALDGFANLADNVAPIEICDDNFDGIYSVNLTQIQMQFLANINGVNFVYYTNSNLTNPINPNQVSNFIVTGNTHFWVEINNGDCVAVREFDVLIRNSVPVNSTNPMLSGLCEETLIDLTSVETQISTNPNVDFSYYNSQIQAQNQTNEITNPTEFSPNNNNGTLYVRLSLAGFCDVILPIQYSLNPLPNNPFDDNFPTLCTGTSLVLDAGDEFPSNNYIWTWGNNQQHIGPEITITEPGTYLLTIQSTQNCEREFTINIPVPIAPIITHFETGENYIIVFAQGNSGLLEYSLNGVFWQTNPRFDNLIPGTQYEVFVRENGCTPSSKKIELFHIPNFISPNGDGYNDTWAIRGLEFGKEVHVKIFDRYGKIFYDKEPQSAQIWDGKYLGRNVPSGEYWYIIEFKNSVETPIKMVGHLSVRNK